MSYFYIQKMPFLKVHRSRIEEILRKNGIFNETEIQVALELVDDCILGKNEYSIHVAVENNTSNTIGYICFGKRPLTDGVYDLYWIVLDPEYHHKGVGHELLVSFEEEVKHQNGRLILAETSSRQVYLKARNFYSKNGYKVIASIDDFYGPQDSLLIYGKYLAHQT